MVLFLLFTIFAVFAALMFTRKMPALLAVPAMAILTAIVVGLPIDGILTDVIGKGAVSLAPAFIDVFAGAMLGRVLMTTGIAEEIIKRAAEFGGDRPLVVAFVLMIATAVLFTTLTGLGAIIMVGSLVLPIMMSLGLNRKFVAVLFLLAFGTGFIFNLALWSVYKQVLGINQIPREGYYFAFGLLAIMTVAVVIYTIVSSRRFGKMALMSAQTKEELIKRDKSKGVPAISFLTPILPLILYIGVGSERILPAFSKSALPAFLVSAIFGVFVTNPKRAIQNLTASMVRGVEDGAPAAILMMGIGMLLNALRLPAVESVLKPLVAALPLRYGWAYVLFFGLLSPLALYRGPLNIFGIGLGIFSLMFTAGLLPPLALLAAMMATAQVQTTSDPTNTHNVWVANYTGVRVEEITKETLLPMILVCIGGLVLGALLFLR